ncbi:hypothetical protein [Dyella sp. 2RAB6]|uniref:hypothetical protein n=1 Tax=Dyella sp. 2RAB6 TaxID=3232992 RepID=UPI003F8F1F3E
MASNDGAGFKGWAVFAGIPAALAGLAAFFPLGLLIAIAAVAAYKHGDRLEKQADALRADREASYRRDERERQLQPARANWDSELEELHRLEENGTIGADEAHERFLALVDRYPQ